MLYYIARFFFFVFFKLFLKLEVVGVENIPKKGAFIFASNHASYLDPILLGTSISRSLNYMAREDLFEKPLLGWMLRAAHSFPVGRGGFDFSAVKRALDMLKKGRPIVIFPEGARSEDGALKAPKRGIGFMALKSMVPIVPAYVNGSFEALPKGITTLRRYPVKVCIGEPMNLEKGFFCSDGQDAYQKLSDEVMRRIAQLKDLSRAN